MNQAAYCLNLINNNINLEAGWQLSQGAQEFPLVKVLALHSTEGKV